MKNIDLQISEDLLNKSKKLIKMKYLLEGSLSINDSLIYQIIQAIERKDQTLILELKGE